MLITLARKPLTGSVVQNVLTHGTGALNVDACRIGAEQRFNSPASTTRVQTMGRPNHSGSGWREDAQGHSVQGRWPANILIDPTPDVLAHFPEVKGQVGMTKTVGGHRFIEGDTTTVQKFDQGKTDTGSAARFFKQIQGD